MSKRKAFNFYFSYYDIAKELTDKDRLAFYDARIKFGSNTKSKWETEQGGGEYATSTLGQITGEDGEEFKFPLLTEQDIQKVIELNKKQNG